MKSDIRVLLAALKDNLGEQDFLMREVIRLRALGQHIAAQEVSDRHVQLYSYSGVLAAQLKSSGYSEDSIHQLIFA
jgi:hypothetical protein